MPNWNSWTMPVTSPRAKLIVKSFPKNFVTRSHSGLWVRTHAVWNAATMPESPMVIGTKRKW